jgi:hypothetical protein
MTMDDLRQSLAAPPPGLTHALAGLWWDGKGDWARAHESAQQDKGVSEPECWRTGMLRDAHKR